MVCHTIKLEGLKCQGDNGQYIQPFWQVRWLNNYALPPHSLQRLLTHQPETHKQYGRPDFPTAIARLLNQYTNKATGGSK